MIHLALKSVRLNQGACSGRHSIPVQLRRIPLFAVHCEASRLPVYRFAGKDQICASLYHSVLTGVPVFLQGPRGGLLSHGPVVHPADPVRSFGVLMILLS